MEGPNQQTLPTIPTKFCATAGDVNREAQVRADQPTNIGTHWTMVSKDVHGGTAWTP